MGKPLILGRRTFESLQRPLPGREIIVVTRDPRFSPPGVRIAHSPLEALAVARRAGQGLGRRRDHGRRKAVGAHGRDARNRIELTEIALEPEGDAFPSSMAQWRKTRHQTPPRGERDEADFAFVAPDPPIDLTRRRRFAETYVAAATRESYIAARTRKRGREPAARPGDGEARSLCRSVAQPGSAPRSGRGGRAVAESSHSDQIFI